MLESLTAASEPCRQGRSAQNGLGTRVAIPSIRCRALRKSTSVMFTSSVLQGPQGGAVCVAAAALQVRARKCELLARAAAVMEALPEESATLAIWHLHRKCIKGFVGESTSPKGLVLLPCPVSTL